jgi:hypothetical protein
VVGGGGYFRPGREKVTASNPAIRNVTHALVVDPEATPRLITRRVAAWQRLRFADVR